MTLIESPAQSQAADGWARYQRMVERIDGVVFEYDPRQDRFTFVSERAAAWLGYSIDEWLAPGFWRSHLHPDDVDTALTQCLAATSQLRDHVLEYRMRARDGRSVWIHDVVTVVHERGAPVLLTGVMLDISAKRDAEGRVLELIDALPDKVFVFDREGRYHSAHIPSGLEPLVPPESLIGHTMRERLPGPIAETFMRHLELTFATARVQQFELDLPFGAELRTYEFRIVPFGPERVIKICRDITQQREFERRVSQAHKLESVGRLAGGVAHDFNNLLTGILSYAELAQGYANGDARLTDALGKIRGASEAAAQLTRQLLTFARKQASAPQVLCASSFVREQEAFLRRVIGERVQLSVRVEQASGRVRIDPVQLQQVLLNLAINARDALAEDGTIRIELSDVELDEDPNERGRGRGPFVRLAVIDDGVGMSPEVTERLFEPFFTTKDLGRGTGMGLATSYGIVSQNGGFIRVHTKEGAGTRVEVLLPAVDEALASERHAPPEFSGGRERVLLVEDQPLVREALECALSALGYRVTTAVDGAQALELALSEPCGAIDVLLSDVVLPKLDGGSLASRLRERDPSLAVVLMSGYAESERFRDPALNGVAFLRKPVTPSAVASALRQQLDLNSTPGS